MRARTSCLLVALWSAAWGAESAEEWEVTLLGGWTAPAVTARIVFESEVAPPDVDGTSVQQQGEYALAGRGSYAFGGALAYYFTDILAIEGRVDTVDYKVDIEGPVITTTTDLPPPLRPLLTVLDLSEGSVNVERLFPFSLNLKVRTGDKVRFVASGGVSFLPRLAFTALQRATFSIGNSLIGTIPIADVAIEADALNDQPASKRFGFNLGAGAQFPLSERTSIIAEARVFGFPRQTLAWRNASVAGSPIEEELLDALRDELGPLELAPSFFQVSGGLVIRF